MANEPKPKERDLNIKKYYLDQREEFIGARERMFKRQKEHLGTELAGYLWIFLRKYVGRKISPQLITSIVKQIEKDLRFVSPI